MMAPERFTLERIQLFLDWLLYVSLAVGPVTLLVWIIWTLG